jgi:hypothetical protein
MQKDILRKIRETVDGSFERERDVSYLLAEIRKYLESSKDAGYTKLRLFCDWALHIKLDRAPARRLVAEMDACFKKAFEYGCTETDIQAFENIVNLNIFRFQLREFLLDHALPDTVCEDDSWRNFLSLYAQIIEDCPMEVSGATTNTHIDRMIVNFVADGADEDERFYPIRWEFFKSGNKRGTLNLRPGGELVGSELKWK